MKRNRLINYLEQLTLKLGGSLYALLLVSFMVIVLPAQAQERTVTGTVTDPSGETVPGATVLEKGTQNGMITDLDGNFKLTLSSDTASISVSFLGYKNQTVVIGSKSVLDVVLQEDVEQLAEVVVIGYGSVEKRDVTGTVALVNEEQFNKGIIGSPDKLLTGKVAGLQIETGGEPGASTNIRLRGVSINGQNPLFVIDGVPLADGGVKGARNPLNFMNPADVENITVLKDASAAAIYGSRGANGVIIITTKNGAEGKMKISYDGFYSISKFTKKVDILTPTQFRAAIFDKAPQEVSNLGDANTVWLDEVLQLASGQNHNLAVSGGGESTNYMVSLNYLDNKGVMRNTRNQKVSIGLKVRQKLLNDNLIIGINSKNGFTKDQFSPNVIGGALRFDPTRPVRVADETTFGGYYQWNNVNAVQNPVSEQDLNDQRGESFRSLSNIDIEYKIPFVKGLSLKANLGYDRNEGEYNGVASADLRNRTINELGVESVHEEETKTSLLSEYYASYENHIQSIDTKLNLVGGYSWQNFKTELTQLRGDSAKYVDGTLTPTLNIFDKPESVENRLISFFARATFDVKDKYLLTASIRRDGSTRFGEKNRWGLFPSVAVAWRVINEDFASGLTGVFSDLKLRVGYGVTGNQEIPNYRYATYYKYSQPSAAYQFGDQFVNTLRPRGVDPDIKWEETVSTNFGLDAGLFGGRLNASLEYYIKNVNDLLYEVVIPAGISVSDRVYTNIGQVENKGFELTLDGVLFDKDNFNWNLGFNVSTNKNVIKKIDNNSDPDFGGYNTGGISGDVGQNIQAIKAGEAVNSFKTYQHIYDESGKPVFGSLLEMYVDQLTVDSDGDGVADAGDGQINELDLVIGESPNPDVLMGITSNMQYKSWDLSFTIRASVGNHLYNNVASSTGYFDLLTDRVTNNIHIAGYETGFKTRQLHSDYYIENASFVKLDNITLGYTFKELKFARVKAYMTAQNLLTITKYSGVDPEVFNGIDNNLYPRSMTFILGVNASF
jgi:iron complex outermembrane receptor protein